MKNLGALCMTGVGLLGVGIGMGILIAKRGRK